MRADVVKLVPQEVSTMPATIRVGYQDYTVEDWKPSEAHVNSRDGECDKHHMVIRVRADLERRRKAEVLLHEVLHAAFSMGDLSGGDSEEKTVTVLGSQMTQVWRDNPEFIAFMEASLRGGK